MSFIKLNQDFTKSEFLNVLETNLDKECVVHFNCFGCDDEQVSEVELTNDLIELVENYKDDKYYLFPIQLPCMECGGRNINLSMSAVQGIEIL